MSLLAGGWRTPSDFRLLSLLAASPWCARAALQRRSRRALPGGIQAPSWSSTSTRASSSTARAAVDAAVVEVPRKVAPKAGSNGERHRSPGRPWTSQALPVQAIIPDILECLKGKQHLVLQAPTGAGKTTLVPLAVLESGVVEGRILVLQPRRITAINVARRMAQLWGQRLGESVGFRIRHENTVSNHTRIEVITEGILVRLLHSNPTLEGIGCIFFDEFHERSIDSDLTFALCMAAQRRQNLPLRFIVMSATFGGLGERVRELLGPTTRVISSEGRCFPVEVSYKGLIDLQDFERGGPQRFAQLVAKVIRQALEEHEGDALVFLPGEREIMYTWIACNNMGIGDGKQPRNLVAWARRLIDTSVDLSGSRVQVSPLYSTLDTQEQDEVLQPPPAGWRKVILATPIAESSLTVPGVRIVIDSGLRKIKKEDPETCVSQMVTVPISRASANQRSGRAGRVSTGVCYRMWDEEQQRRLSPTDEPELHRSDLAGVVLDLAQAGAVSDQEISALPWVDAPRVEDLDLARALLLRMQALERLQGGRLAITERGRKLGRFPVHPRIAHMIQQASEVSVSMARDACDLAALMEEKELLQGGRVRHGADLEARLDALQDRSTRGVIFNVRDRVLKASEQLQTIADLNHVVAFRRQEESERRCLGVLIAWAYPELVATFRKGVAGKPFTVYKLATGGEARLDQKDALSKSQLLTIASITGMKVFWAMRADAEALASYGVDVEDPLRHAVLGSPSPASAEAGGSADGEVEEAPSARLVVVNRYLLGKDCGKISDADDLLHAMVRFPEQFPPREVASMLWDLAREEPPQEELLRRVAQEVVTPRAEDFSPGQLAEVACALVVGQAASETAFATIAEALAPRLNELPLDSEDGNLSGLLWAFTVAEVAAPELLQSMARRAAQALVDFEPKVLSDVREVCFWSFHRASASAWSDARTRFRGRIRRGFASSDFFDLFAPIVVERLDEINPISCVYLMWSFSKADMVHQELFDAIAERVGPVVSSLDRCGLTMFCWNYAYGDIANEDVYRLVSEDTLRPERMAEMAPRDVSGIAWAIAKAKAPHEALLPELLRHGCGLLRDGLEQRCYRFTGKSLRRAIYEGDNSARDGAVDAFDMVSMGDILWACAELQHVDAEFLELSREYMALGLRQPSTAAEKFYRYPQVMTRALHSFARLNPSLHDLFSAAAPHLIRHLDSMRIRDVAMLCWAWAMSGPHDPWMLSALDTRLRGLVAEEAVRQLDAVEAENLNWAVTELGLGDRQTKTALYEASSA